MAPDDQRPKRHEKEEKDEDYHFVERSGSCVYLPKKQNTIRSMHPIRMEC
jgi:hypothetical protein